MTPLRRSRKARGLTQVETGALVGCSQAQFRRHELPPADPVHRAPKGESMIVLCAVFGLTPNDFYDMDLIRAAAAAASGAASPASAAEAARAVIAAWRAGARAAAESGPTEGEAA